MIGVKWSTPYMPRLLIVKVPPLYSSGSSLPCRALPLSSAIWASLSWPSDFWSAFLINRDDQAVVHRHRHADIDTALIEDKFAADEGVVDHREFGESLGRAFDDQFSQRKLRADLGELDL